MLILLKQDPPQFMPNCKQSLNNKNFRSSCLDVFYEESVLKKKIAKFIEKHFSIVSFLIKLQAQVLKMDAIAGVFL